MDIDTLATGTPTPADARLDALLVEMRRMNTNLERLDRRVDELARRNQAIDDLMAEVGPIGREVMRVATSKLAALEARGYFAVGAEALELLDRVVTTLRPGELAALGDNVVAVLDTVKHVTASPVLQIANEASDALDSTPEPVGLMGMLKASQDEDVERGLGITVEVLRRIGKASQAPRTKTPKELGPPTCGTNKLKDRLAPRRNTERAAAPKATPKAAPARKVEDAPLPETWTRAYAEETAAAMGLALTDAHWKVLDFIRADYAEHGASPNLRRITMGTGLATRDVYALFPKAPGKAAARLAGVPKPAGCI